MSDNCAVTQPPIDNTADALREAGDLLMRRRRWAEASLTFERLPDRNAATEMKRRLSSNLASLQQHRPEVYETLVNLPAQQRFSVATTTTGAATVLFRRPDGSCVSLSAGNDPETSANAAKRQLYAATKAGEAIGLCGMGD